MRNHYLENSVNKNFVIKKEKGRRPICQMEVQVVLKKYFVARRRVVGGTLVTK